MNDKFKIIDLEKKLIVSFDKNLSNFPHKEIELKSEIISTTYNMLKTTLEANASFDAKKRENIQDSIIASIKYLDFLVNRCLEKGIITKKKYLKFGSDLDYLLRNVLKWREKGRAEVM